MYRCMLPLPGSDILVHVRLLVLAYPSPRFSPRLPRLPQFPDAGRELPRQICSLHHKRTENSILPPFYRNQGGVPDFISVRRVG